MAVRGEIVKSILPVPGLVHTAELRSTMEAVGFSLIVKVTASLITQLVVLFVTET